MDSPTGNQKAQGASAAASIFSVGIPLLPAAITFLFYWPSLSSGFVYDARSEILGEGFITSLSNLPAVLSLKVLGMPILLGDRPGQILYLMLIAAVCGKAPFGYHLCSNLLHAANAALLFVLLRRLASAETALRGRWKIDLAAMAVTLIFALHPVAVEAVAGISYSSDLLVTFFALLALLAATVFHPGGFRAWLAGGAGTLCAFAAVTCKESGLAAAVLLIVYWFLFRRGEAKKPWFCFLGAAAGLTAGFLIARFAAAPASPVHLTYPGGSFSQALWIQPRLWVFMMGQLIWPTHLSADYTLEDMDGLGSFFALLILIVVVALQIWLAYKSRIGALGVAVYWVGLVTVSNFTPLYHILGDRFYYLPLTGVAMQLLALLILMLKSPQLFWIILGLLLIALIPLATLSLERQKVFATELSLWVDTIQASPYSQRAQNGLGTVLLESGRVDEALPHLQKALEIDPHYSLAHLNYGVALALKGQTNAGVAELQQAMAIDPNAYQPHYDLGCVLFQLGRVDEAIVQYQEALKIESRYPAAHTNLGMAYLKKGQKDEAIAEFREALRLDPQNSDAQAGLAKAQALH